jgi:hypothetical protein
MAVQSDTTGAPAVTTPASEISKPYMEGIVAGVIGAAAIALWFLIIDLIGGRPFYTPNVLGTALFLHGVGLDQPDILPISFEMVVFYTWVHGLAFCVLGGLAAMLITLAERNLNIGFGIMLLFVVFEFGFLGAAFIFAEPILRALAWPTVLFGNLIAAAAMAIYFWRRHPNLRIEP